MSIKILFLSVLFTLTVSAAEAVNVTIKQSGGVMEIGETGSFDILVDIAPEAYTFKNGALNFRIDTTNAGVLKFTNANVSNPDYFGGFRSKWSATEIIGLRDNSIDELLAISVNTPGLNPTAPYLNGNGSATSFKYASVKYEVIGIGATSIIAEPINTRPGAFIVHEGVDVTDDVNFTNFGNGFEIRGVPEPTSQLLASLVGLLSIACCRRRYYLT